MDPVTASSTKPRSTILLAEDDADDILLIGSAFKEARIPYRLAVVEDGDQAICYLNGDGPYEDRVAHPMPFLLLLDLKMPAKSGFEVLSWIRSQRSLDGLRVVILSTSALADDVCKASQLGGNSYLVKSAGYKQLVCFLRSLNPVREL